MLTAAKLISTMSPISLGMKSVVAREDRKGLPRWVESLFAFMERNSVHVSDFFRLPADSVVEIGRQVAI